MRQFQSSASSLTGWALTWAALVSLAACGTTREPETQTRARSPMETRGQITRSPESLPLSADTEAPDLGALGDFSIPSGKCGMILYTRANELPAPIFRSTNDGRAIMQIEGSLTEMALVAKAGEARVSIPSFQLYDSRLADGRSVTVEVETSWGDNFPGGAFVQAGTVTLKGADGWSRVLPVAGIAGCKA